MPRLDGYSSYDSRGTSSSGSSHRTPNRQANPGTDVPQFSRLFILGDGNASEDDYREGFSQYGTIEYISCLDNKKGVCYIKYKKASEAFRARSAMNKETLPGKPKPMKVMISASKEEGASRDDPETRALRVFIKIPQEWNVDIVRKNFSEYGDIDKINVLKHSETEKPKGLCFIKYFRAEHAALALENCDQHLHKPVWPNPERSLSRSHHESNVRDDEYTSARDSYRGGAMGGARHAYHDPYESYADAYTSYGSSRERYVYEPGSQDISLSRSRSSAAAGSPMDMISALSPSTASTRMNVLADSSLTVNQLTLLFDLVPGMEASEFEHDKENDVFRGKVKYSTPQCASYAQQKFNEFEYPPGLPLIVKLDQSRPAAHNNSAMVSDIQQKLQNLRRVADEERGGYSGSQDQFSSLSQREVPHYTQIELPRKQILLGNIPVVKRCFIVCTRERLPQQILDDLFCRFGNLREVFLLPGKNYGYAEYGTVESADAAISTLHMQTFENTVLKVIEAEDRPGQSGRGEPAQKRPKMDEYTDSSF